MVNINRSGGSRQKPPRPYVGGDSLKDIGVDKRKIEYVAVFLFISFFTVYLILKHIRAKRKAVNK